MADKVKLRKIANDEREAYVLDKISYDSSNNILSMYSSLDSSMREETPINISNIEIDTTLAQSGKAADAKVVGDKLNGKVNVVSGKTLSTNDYTNADKKKVDDIEITSPTNGQALVYNSSTQKWVNKTISNGGGSGQDGFSPTIVVTNITGGHRVTITDVDGTKTFDVMDGATGAKGDTGATGANGFSPTVTVANIAGGHRVSITDVNGTKTFNVMDGSGSGGGTTVEVYYVTPEDYGAAGDGTTDDSNAIQQAIDSGETVVFSRKTYFIHSPIVINEKNNWTMNAQDAVFVYDGTAYAFRILSAENCNISLGTVRANNGGGIEFYSASGDSWNQYINLSFNIIECKTNCIRSFAETGGWCNENRIFGGRFASGENGVSISHANGNETDGWKFYNCGIEGVTNGFLFDAGASTQGRISGISIINPRYAESYSTVLKTVGSVFDCLWVGTFVFKPTEIDCSENTSRFEILAPIGTIWDEGVYRHRGCITNGEFIAEVTLYDGQTPTSIDTTLTVKGAAADAKAVGDKFNEIFIEKATNNIFNKDTAVTGSYVNPYTGEIVNYDGVFHAFIELQVGTYTFLAQHGIFGGNAYTVAMFDENYNFVSYTEGTHTEIDSMNTIVTVTFSSQAVSTAKYFSINGTTDILNTLMVVKGTNYPTEYIEYGSYKTIDGLQITKSQIIDLDDEANPLKGKIISLNGDSIASGVGYQGGYGKIIAEENGMTYENVAVGGGTVAYVGANNHCISRTINNMREDADYIILDGGGNDADSGVALGTLSTGYDATLDDTTFAGAFESMLKAAIARFPTKKIGYVFIHKCAYLFDSRVANSYYDIAKAACEKWGIPYCDLNTQTPPLNYISDLKTAYTANGDGYHPNEQGYKLFYVPKITAWLKTL